MSRHSYGALKDLLLPHILAGDSNMEIKAAHPHLDTNVIGSRASQLRKQLGVQARKTAPSGIALRLPRRISEQLTQEAFARGIRRGNGHEIAREILEIVVRDNLFDAILGEIE